MRAEKSRKVVLGDFIEVPTIDRSCKCCIGDGDNELCNALLACLLTDNKTIVFIRDTPEAWAAYIAQKLEGK